jgi:alpha-galactosidase
MARQRIVLIGAGSAMFTQGLVADLILSQQPWDIRLVDIDPQALATAEGLTRRMVETKQADIVVRASTDRRDLLPQADVVITTIGVGGRRAWETDVLIPRQYGIFQPVGDTIMAGGISRALRMVPALVEIAKDVLTLCPTALFFNYANPMTVNCWAVRQATGANVVGLCHGVMHVERELAQFLGVPPAEVTSLAVGVNHFTWMYDLRRQGKDAWPLVRAQLAEGRSRPVADAGLGQMGFVAKEPAPERPKAASNPFSWSLFDRFGAYPAVNDRHVTEFFPQQFPSGAYFGKTLGVDAFSFEATIAFGDRVYEEMTQQALGQAPLNDKLFQRGPGEHEQLLDILRSIDGDERKLFSANLPNRGAVPNLPADAVLEIPAVATASGLRAVQITEFPDHLATPLRPKLESQRITVEAALTGSRTLFVQALLSDGCVSDPVMAERLADDLLRAQKQYLPQFA